MVFNQKNSPYFKYFLSIILYINVCFFTTKILLKIKFFIYKKWQDYNSRHLIAKHFFAVFFSAYIFAGPYVFCLFSSTAAIIKVTTKIIKIEIIIAILLDCCVISNTSKMVFRLGTNIVIDTSSIIPATAKFHNFSLLLSIAAATNVAAHQMKKQAVIIERTLLKTSNKIPPITSEKSIWM